MRDFMRLLAASFAALGAGRSAPAARGGRFTCGTTRRRASSREKRDTVQAGARTRRTPDERSEVAPCRSPIATACCAPSRSRSTTIARALRHALLRLFARRHRGGLCANSPPRLRGRDALVCYSVKANSNLAILALLARLGAGFDIVSGRRARARARGRRRSAQDAFFRRRQDAKRRSSSRCARASAASTSSRKPSSTRVDALARRLGRARADRVPRESGHRRANPSVYLDRPAREQVRRRARRRGARSTLRSRAMPELELVGIGCHIGSLLTEASAFRRRGGALVALVDRLEAAGIRLRHIDVGGGIGIRYKDETPQPIARLRVAAPWRRSAGAAQTLIVRPGPLHRRQRRRAADAGRIREARRGAQLPGGGCGDERPHPPGALRRLARRARRCARRDASAHAGCLRHRGPGLRKRRFPRQGAQARCARRATCSPSCPAGAYGMSMSSNYNSRPRAAEVLVQRRRSPIWCAAANPSSELFALERIPA